MCARKVLCHFSGLIQHGECWKEVGCKKGQSAKGKGGSQRLLTYRVIDKNRLPPTSAELLWNSRETLTDPFPSTTKRTVNGEQALYTYAEDNTQDRLDEALRQSATAAANGFGVRWEVPSVTIQVKAQSILSTLGIENIDVVVVPR